MIPRATFIDKTLSDSKSMKTSSWLSYARPAATDAASELPEPPAGPLNPE
jgi:hypothetical protein